MKLIEEIKKCDSLLQEMEGCIVIGSLKDKIMVKGLGYINENDLLNAILDLFDALEKNRVEVSEKIKIIMALSYLSSPISDVVKKEKM